MSDQPPADSELFLSLITSLITASCDNLRRNLERVRRLLFECINRSVVLEGHA